MNPKHALQPLWAATVWLMLALSAPMAGAAADVPGEFDDPQPLVEEKINELLRRLKENREQIRNDESIAYRISDELIAPYIDFPRVTRLIIGKYWRTATEEQRQQLVEQVRELLIRSYVTAMRSYIDDIVSNADSFHYRPSRYRPGDRKASVVADFDLDGGQTVEVQYQLYYRDAWKIYDIRIEGISLVLTYRTSFGEQIRRDGLDQLIARLVERNRKGDVELPDSIGPLSQAKAADGATPGRSRQ